MGFKPSVTSWDEQFPRVRNTFQDLNCQLKIFLVMIKREYSQKFHERKDTIRGCCGFVYPLVIPLRQHLSSTLSMRPRLFSFLPRNEKKSGVQRSGGDHFSESNGTCVNNQLDEVHMENNYSMGCQSYCQYSIFPSFFWKDVATTCRVLRLSWLITR